MKTTAVFFPFDLFGAGGCGNGALLLAEAFDEILTDNEREPVPTRARIYRGQVRTRRFSFEKMDDYENWRKRAAQAVRRVLRQGDFLLWVTGNHLGTLPVYDELANATPASAQETVVVQLDAHLDIQNFAECTKELSHGNFLLKVAGTLPKIINLGNRDLLLRGDYIKEFYQQTFSAAALLVDPEPGLQAICDATRQAKRVFIDIDCDAFDPSYFPAVTHPQPFGLTPELFLRILQASWSERVIGVSLAEFDPGRDRNDQSLSILAWLMEYLLLKRYECSMLEEG